MGGNKLAHGWAGNRRATFVVAWIIIKAGTVTLRQGSHGAGTRQESAAWGTITPADVRAFLVPGRHTPGGPRSRGRHGGEGATGDIPTATRDRPTGTPGNGSTPGVSRRPPGKAPYYPGFRRRRGQGSTSRIGTKPSGPPFIPGRMAPGIIHHRGTGKGNFDSTV